MLQITVYKRADAFRVVAGAHTAHADSSKYRVTVYADAPLAYTAETDPAIRAAIARIAPDAAKFIAPLSPIKKVSLRAEHFVSRAEQRRVEMSRAVADSCPGAFSWGKVSPGGEQYHCPKCFAVFTRAELQGRDDHIPPHASIARKE